MFNAGLLTWDPDLKLSSKLCSEFSAVCVLSKEISPYFFEKCHTADDLKLSSKLCSEFSAVCVLSEEISPISLKNVIPPMI